MRLEKDGDSKVVMMDMMRTYLANRQRGMEIHVSDLTSPLRSYYDKLHPAPASDREILMWLVGEGHHVFLVQSLAGVDGSQEGSFIDPDTGIHYSPDLVTLQAEFKTTRWFKLPTTGIETHTAVQWYYDQCKAYASFMQARLIEPNTWKLVVLFICPYQSGISSKDPALEVFKLVWSDEELADARRELGEKAALLQAALDARDPTTLPLCKEAFCWRKHGRGRGKKALMEPLCGHWERCKPAGRYEAWQAEQAEYGEEI